MAIGKYSSKIKLPILRYDVEISYSEVEKPSGIAYILLMMVQAAGKNDFSWQDLMDQFGLPTAMFGVFRDELESMKQKGMVDYTYAMTLRTPVNTVTMTETGKKAFDQGIITSQNKSKLDTALYFPGEGTRKFQIFTPKKSGFMLDGADDRYRQIPFDTKLMDQFIEQEKNLFYIRSSETIFSINHIRQSYCSYYSSVGLSFNETLGAFSIIGSKKIDERFVKKYVTIDELFDNLETDPFMLPDELSGVSHHETNDWDNFVYVLPSDLSLKNEKYVISTLGSDIPGAYVVDKLEDGSDFVVITSKSIGFAYRIVQTPISISGMEGSMIRPVLVKRMISADTISSLMYDVARSQYDGSIISLSNSLQILDRVSNDDGAESLIKDYIRATFDVKGAHEITRIYKKSKWNKMIRSWILDLLADMSHKERLALCKAVYSTKISINGQQAGFLLRSSDAQKNLELADAMFKILSPNTVHPFLESMEIADDVSQYIVESKTLDSPVSELFKNMNYASISLKGLRDFTGASEISDYFYSYEAIKPENKPAIIKYSKDLTSRLEYLQGYVASEGLDDLKDLASVYSDISSTLDDDDVDFKTSNGRIFGIHMRIWIEEMLKRLLDDQVSTLEILIDKANKIYVDPKAKVKLIDNKQRAVLDQIRHYGNSCAHDKTVFPREEDEKQHWINIAEEVEQAIDVYLSKKSS